jgi:membrane fusion protein
MSQSADSTADDTESLFRPEALEQHANRLWGEVHVSQPFAQRALALLSVTAVLAIGAFVSTQEYARTEAVQGYLTPSVGVSKLMPTRRGTVTRVEVAAGDSVIAGQVIAVISSEPALASGASAGEALRGKLDEQRAELRRKVELETSVLGAGLRDTRSQLAALDGQIAKLDKLAGIARERCDLAEDKVRSYSELLARGFATRLQYQERLDAQLDLQSELGKIETSLLERRQARASAAESLRMLPLRHAQALADVRVQLSEVETRRTELESQGSFAIRSPVAGRVAALQATVGASVDPAVPVAVLLPAGGELEARLFVPARAIGFIESGQEVGLKYAAFPYQQFGIQRATVRDVSSALLTPEELSAPLALREPSYSLVATLEMQSVRAYGKQYPLQLGMLADAEILLERRTILEWLLAPLRALRGR